MKRVKNLLQRNFVKDVLTLQAGSVFFHGLAFLKSIIFARMLGLDGFGLYAVTLAFTGTIAVFTNFGQNQASLIFFAESYAKNDENEMKSVLKYYMQLTILALILYVLLAWYAPLIAAHLYPDQPLLGITGRLAFIFMMSGLFDTFFVNLLQTVREIKLMTVLEMLNGVLQFIFAIGMLLLDFGLPGIFYGLILSNILMLCIYNVAYFTIRNNYNLPSVRKAFFHKGNSKKFVKQGLWIALDKNIGNLYPKSFLFILSLFSPAATVGIAQLAFKIGGLPRSLFLPHISRMAMSVLPGILTMASGEIRKTCALLIKHTLFFHAIVSFVSLLALPTLTLFLYGIEYSEVIPPMLWIVLIGIFSALNVANSPLFRSMHKAHIPAIHGGVSQLLLCGLLYYLLGFVNPLNAFVMAIACGYVLNFVVLNGYLYRTIKKL